MRPSSVLAALLGLAALVSTTCAPPAGADPVASCTATRGVLVVVDFRHFGGSLQRGCDATPTTGFDALHAAGFTTAGTVHDGTGFVCRIDDRPSPAQDPCFNTPPATAYWSYWHASAGSNSWSYSKFGAQSYRPGDGSVDAWVFGGTSAPSFAPSAVRAVASTPHPSTSSRPVTHHASSTRHPTHSAAAVTRAGTETTTSTASATTRAPSHPSSTTRPTSARATSSSAGITYAAVPSNQPSPSFVDATPAATKRDSSGTPWPLLIGLLLAVALGGGAGWTVLRRRRAAP